jgi:ATP-dependent Lhr-like helicase
MTTPFPRSDSADAVGQQASSAFDRLDTRLQHWLWAQKWGALRPVQEAAIHAVLDFPTRDVILSAPTASGKTEAAFLPLCTRLLAHQDGGSVGAAGIDVLYISPLKALINDQFGRLDRLCEALEIHVHRWHGDVSASRKQQVFRKPNGILLITPESLEALFVRHGTQMRRLFGALDAVVIDELHAFFGSERGRQLQSLLHRVEAATGRRTPRIALSATLSDLSAAALFLRPGEDATNVLRLAPPADQQEIQAQIRGYVRAEPPPTDDVSDALLDPDGGADTAIAAHLFSVLRGRQNLVFANTRHEVEGFTDRLARLAEAERVPNEFFAHHGSLSRELRHDVEERLRDGERPVTAVCTSTLELGIDIGAMHTVAQIGAAPSVAALRQRLGRSGRRAGEPCRLRVYVREAAITPRTPLIDQLRLETVQAVAQMNLLVRGWCEPPDVGGLHLSTLVQQTLSAIAERGGMGASPLWCLLCRDGPFRDIDQSLFADFLRAVHAAGLVAQMESGTLLLGPTGERVTDHYTFYAAFATPEEYRLTAQGKTLGTLPITRPLAIGAYLIYGGRRWKVIELDDRKRLIDLAPAPGGRAPEFGGAGVWVDAAVREEMRRVYEASDVPPFLDRTARALLAEGRDHYDRLGLANRRIVSPAGSEVNVFLWSSDRAAATLYLEFLRRGIAAEENGVCVTARDTDEPSVRAVLEHIAVNGFSPPEELAALVPNAEEEKHEQYLTPALRARQYAARCLDTETARAAVVRALAGR